MAARAWTLLPPELASSSPSCEPRRHPPSFGQGSMAEAMLCQLLLPDLREGHFLLLVFKPSWSPRASLVAQTVKNQPAMQETRVQSLGQEDPLEKGMTTHSSILAWRIP